MAHPAGYHHALTDPEGDGSALELDVQRAYGGRGAHRFGTQHPGGAGPPAHGRGGQVVRMTTLLHTPHHHPGDSQYQGGTVRPTSQQVPAGVQ
jgi:hypothetical protein